MGIRKAKITPSINVDDMLKKVEIVSIRRNAPFTL